MVPCFSKQPNLTQISVLRLLAMYSSVEKPPPQHQVFINFCEGKNFRLNGFVYHLVEALLSNKINVYEDMEEHKGRDLEVRLKKIAESRIALVIFSGKYTESTSCLRELAKINDCVKKGKLVAIPILFKLEVSTVKGLRGQFGDAFRNLRGNKVTKENWEEALESIAKTLGNHKVDKKSSCPQPDSEIYKKIVEEVKENLNKITLESNVTRPSSARERDKPFGIKRYLKKGRRLLLLFFCLQHIASLSTSSIDKGGVVNGIVENIQKVFGTKIPRDNYTELPNGNFDAKGGNYFPDAKTNAADFLNRTNTKCPVDGKIKPQVFINFRGAELRKSFIGYLVDALQRSEINVFIDNLEQRGEDLNNLFKRIEESGIAIVVFSSRYTESTWCLEELVKIKERVHQGLLKVLPIFYKVTPTHVKRRKGDFGDHFRDKEYLYGSEKPIIKRWKEAIAFVSHRFALTFDEQSSRLENDFVRIVVEEVLKMLQAMSPENSDQCFR